MRLLPILLVMISALASYGQVDAQVRPLEPPREAGSKWSIVRTKDGEELSRTLVNRTFDFAFRYINGRETDLLFSQEVRTTYKLS